MPEKTQDWRLIQIFLQANPHAVFEVETDWGADTEEISLRCTCLPGIRYGHCKHMDVVREACAGAEGVTVLPVHYNTPVEELHEAVTTGGQTYRDFVLKYGLVAVL